MLKKIVLLLALLSFSASAKGWKALMLTGGCCHDYTKQKVIISEALKKSDDVTTDIIHEQNMNKMKEILSKKDWHKGYDFVIYNICHAHEKDGAFVDSVTKVHHDGLPAIALHCTMHSYHWKIKGDKSWTKFLGVVSPGHGPKKSIIVKTEEKAKDHPIMKGIPENWTTPKGELYRMKEVLDTATVLASGVMEGSKEGTKPTATVWVNTYGKGKVFGCSLGHHNETMEAKPYLDMLSNAVKWLMKDK